jgi:hypothetical protein
MITDEDKDKIIVTINKYKSDNDLYWQVVQDCIENLPENISISWNGAKVPITRRDVIGSIVIVCLRNNFNSIVRLFKFLMFKAKYGNHVQNNGSRINYDFDDDSPPIFADEMYDAGLLHDFGNTNYCIDDEIIKKIKELIDYAKKEPNESIKDGE